jgi:cellulose biosynthesis protein BcsQ
LVAFAAEHFGKDNLGESAIIRDAGGRLAIVVPLSIDERQRKEIEAELREKLGEYARPEAPIVDLTSPGARRLLHEAKTSAPIAVGTFQIRLLDRRIVGADWLRPPAETAPGIPRLVFTSLKGGVGRSTALCVLAAHFSRRGRRVLAIDFDLEAPGIGTMLLDERELPPFGTLDYLVENSISGIDSAFMADLAGDSFLGADGARVTVVPAIGRRTVDNPRDALAKIARAYLEDPNIDGPAVTLSVQFREMIDRFEKSQAYDVVLIDARAGLHETAAAAILAIGGEVLLFGIDHPQTFLGYRLLMAHLARFPVDTNDDWRERLRFVHGKASDSQKLRSEAAERFAEIYDIIAPPQAESEKQPERLTADDFEIDWDENAIDGIEQFEAPPILYVLDDTRYRDFDPVSDRDLLVSQSYAATFGPILEYGDIIIDAGQDAK